MDSRSPENNTSLPVTGDGVWVGWRDMHILVRKPRLMASKEALTVRGC